MSRRTRWATTLLVGMTVGGCAATGPSSESTGSGSTGSASVMPSSQAPGPVTERAEVTPEEARLVDDFVAFALDPSASTLQGLSLSPEGVRIGLGEDLIKGLAPGEADDPASWRITTDTAFRGYVGPFSALETVRSHVQGRRDSGLRKSGDITVSAGPHPHCVSPPVPAPSGLRDMSRVSVQPAGDAITSCLAWFSVDFFLDSDGEIVAVTLDLWEP